MKVNIKKSQLLAVIITIAVAAPLTLWGIYGIGQYGMALFIITPFFIGLSSALILGRWEKLTPNKSRKIGFLTLLIFTAGLVLFAIEGLICIAMAVPPALLLTWLGSFLANYLTNKSNRNVAIIYVLVGLLIPCTAFLERNKKPEVLPVVTSIIISASPEVVWKNVIEFPDLEPPREFLFKAGISYPINARIEGHGVGAIRYCNFNTGSFVEPITIWEKPKLLAFDVKEQPKPMTELSFWDIDAPHLQDYFVAKKGQFKLTPLPNGKTELEGTTWYVQKIYPGFYWNIWSNSIIHAIHDRVLAHIKKESERN
ncbi:hypothetical protein JR347_16050 [Fulvivirga lutea]|uniref:SRPBCC family protein n=1 Tax=Fulvivirga lutea TaxID=2810512 RepID=A0A975A2M0_9BACT|nr:hypothetical protein JR347_16050 [Fulvivirga lutea]